MFTDRKEVGLRPLERVPPLDPENTVALALPHGGLPVADVIAEALGFRSISLLSGKTAIWDSPNLPLVLGRRERSLGHG